MHKINITSLQKTSLILLVITVLLLCLRGANGNPNSEELTTPVWKDEGVFELSPERGRFALTYSIIEDHSLWFSKNVALFASPDVAEQDGKYVSLFAPTVSFLVMPGYFLGRYLGVSQVGTFAVIAIFALMNVLLIRSISTRLGANPIAATVAGLLFLVATPSFSYAVTLYQHHVSTFLILLSLYFFFNWKRYLSLCVIFFVCGLSVSVDNPNFFIMLPIAIAAVVRLVSLHFDKKLITVELKLFGLATVFMALIPFGLFLYFNQQSYGSPFQLAGTTASASFKENSNGVDIADKLTQQFLEDSTTSSGKPEPNTKKSALGFFKTRNIPHGLYEHILSSDRGMLFFTPIMLVGSLGLISLYKRNQNNASLLLAVIGMNVLLYSMWGDPYGGWAFGSRYLIPTYAICAILLAQFLTQIKRSLVLLIAVFLISVFSLGVNTVGALTSNRNPPKVEILALEAITNRRERFSFDRNYQMLQENSSKSYVFNEYISKYLNAKQFAGILTSALILFTALQLIALYYSGETDKKVAKRGRKK